MRFKVHFIGSGYESVKAIVVMAATPMQAMLMAENMYDLYRWNFQYSDMIAEVQR